MIDGLRPSPPDVKPSGPKRLATSHDDEEIIHIPDIQILLDMPLEDLRSFAQDKLGLDVAGIEEGSIILQQILAQDEDLDKE